MIQKLKYALILLILNCTLLAWGESNIHFFFKSDSQYQDVIIGKVISSDTFIIKNYSARGETIKLIGLKAPKPPKPEKTKRVKMGAAPVKKINLVTSVEEQAFDFARHLLEGQHVRLEFDASKIDDEHKTLAYVFLLEGNVFVNTEILRQGFANLSINPANKKYTPQLREAYQEARREKRGMQFE